MRRCGCGHADAVLGFQQDFEKGTIMYETCVECGAEDAPVGALYCEDCDVETTDLAECSGCGHEFDPSMEGEYDTCGDCLEDAEQDAVDSIYAMR